MVDGWAHLFVLLGQLPPPAALEGLLLVAVIHLLVQRLAQRQVAVVTAPHACAHPHKKSAHSHMRLLSRIRTNVTSGPLR